MSGEIPFHIQEEIMKRLPVVSLLRFRFVSKAWKSLIESSDFIASHSVTQPQHLLLSYEDPVETTEKYVSFMDDDSFPQQRFVHTLLLSVKLLKSSRIVGSSHGLLCFRGYYEEEEDFSPNLETEILVLWNPSIRKSITVHMPNSDYESDLGFGVCPVSGDPKIVQITQFINQTRYHCEAKVYKVSSGKWTTLSTNLPSKPFRILWSQVVVDRFIYWCAFDRTTRVSGLPNHNMIMSFDTTNENFGVVDLPDGLRRHPSTRLGISKLRESIVMVEYDKTVSFGDYYDVWMMEDGDEKSFTKLFTVEVPLYYYSLSITTLGFRKNGQPLLEVVGAHKFNENSEFVVYEPYLERFSYLEINGTPETFSVHSYMDSLVLIGRSDFNV